MTLDPRKMLDLMAYADGELEGDEARAVELLLATDERAANLVDNVGRLGDYLALGHSERAEFAAEFDVADDVMAKIDAPAAPAASVSVDVAPAKGAAPAKGVALAKETVEPVRSAEVVSLEAARTRGARRWAVGGGIVAALAVAASVFFFLRPREEPMALSPNAASRVSSDDPAGGVEVTAFGAPGQSVSVFYLPSTNEVSTNVVVWVDETGGK